MKALRKFALINFIALQLLWPFQAYAFAPALGIIGSTGARLLLQRGIAPLIGGSIAFGICKMLQMDICEPANDPLMKFDGKPGITPPNWNDPVTPKPTGYVPYWKFTFDMYKKDEVTQACMLKYQRKDITGVVAGYYQAACVITGSAGELYLTGWSSTLNYCIKGYANRNNRCEPTATFAQDLPKPEGVPCEITAKRGAFAYDTRNPACAIPSPVVVKNDCVFELVSSSKVTINCAAQSVEITPTEIRAKSDKGEVIIPIPNWTDTGAELGTPVENLPTDYDPETADPVYVPPDVGTEPGTGSGTGSGTGAVDTGTIVDAISDVASSIGDAISAAVQPLADSLQEIKDFIMPADIPEPDLSTKKTPNESVPVALDTSDRFMGGTAGCPPPLEVSFTLGGQTATIPLTYEPLCLFASYMRPFFILTAYISAAFIIFRN